MLNFIKIYLMTIVTNGGVNLMFRQKQLTKAEEGIKYTDESRLYEDLIDNEKKLEEIFVNCNDFYIKHVNIKEHTGRIVYINGLVNNDQLDDTLLDFEKHYYEGDSATYFMEKLQKSSVVSEETTLMTTWQDVIEHITKGDAVLFFNKCLHGLAISGRNKGLDRSLTDPPTEQVLRGSRIGLIENTDVNVALIRNRIRTPYLKTEKHYVGDVSQTPVVMIYIDKYADSSVVEEVRNRLTRMEAAIILESGHIEEMICDGKRSAFPLMQLTERPDTVSALLFEGKVGIIIHGTPMVLVVPTTFWEGFQSVEDYHNPFIFATAVRWLRYLFALVALFLPSFYISVTTFHHEVLPTPLALSIATAREPSPFPTIVEVLMMEIVFEGLREAGIRLPPPIGLTISIVGALVIGEAAVQAGIVSAPIVIVVALTGIASFLIPKLNMNLTIRLCRFPIMFLSAIFGLYGIGISLIAFLIHITNLQSVGVPYLSPIAPFHAAGLKDVLFRAPVNMLYKKKNHHGIERDD
jgi:spore germination protein KA